MKLLACLILAGWCADSAADADTMPKRYAFSRPQMGVPFVIRLYAEDEESANAAAEAAFARIEELNDLLSDYDPKSELMRLCRTSGSGKPVRVSEELFHVLSRSVAISERSHGAFDVTIGPVVRLWRRARRRRKMPDADRLAEARAAVGWRKIHLDRCHRTVELRAPNMRLDLGGIAKGYAGDEALRVLRRHGIGRALIDAGGDIVVGDPPPGRDGWRIGIAPLDEPGEAPSRYLSLANQSVATSGDAFQFVEIDGKRYSHIVDPRTGLGLTDHSSVTVVAPTGIDADALASTVSVLGPRKGIALIECTPPTATVIVRMHENEPRISVSRRLYRYEQVSDRCDGESHSETNR